MLEFCSDARVFDWLTRKRRRKQVHDPLFGPLVFREAKDPSKSYWEGRGHFGPTAAEIGYLVKAGDAGPHESHRVAFHRIEERYPEVLRLVTPLLEREYAAQIEGFDPSPRAAAFALDAIYIPETDSGSMEWALDFSCDQGDDWLFTVHMQGWRPTGQISVMH
jgi:hypothetical protein